MQQDKKAIAKKALSSLEESKDKKRTYRKYKKEDMDKFFLITEKGMSIRGAAETIKIPKSIAFNRYKKGIESLEADKDIQIGESNGSKKVGRPAILTDIHKDYLVNFVDENPSIVLDDMMTAVTSQFAELKIKKSSLHSFVKEKCKIILKRAYFHSVERNSPKKIEERYEWVRR